MSEETGRRLLTFPEPEALGGGVPCPFVPLGHASGQFFLIDSAGQLRRFVSRDLTALGLTDLCGMPPGGDYEPDAWLVQVAPAFDQKGEPTGDFSAKRAGLQVQALCRRAGLFDPMTEQRSAGTWPGGVGDLGDALLVHFGDLIEVWRQGRLSEERGAGFMDGGAVYVAAPRRVRRPGMKAFTGAEAMALVRALNLWGFRDGMQADLLAGIVAAGFLGAAPHWRAHGAVAAPPGSGKTELAKFIGTVMGPSGEYSNDFSEAYLRQKLNGQARVLILDEMEAEAHGGVNPAAKAVQLIRRLSGEEGLRGGRGSAGGVARGFTLAGSGLIFGVTLPPMEAADRSRFITLALSAPRGSAAELGRAKAWAESAADGLRLRMLSLWPVFRPCFDVFAQALDLDRALTGRPANVFGVVLTGRWLLEHDRPPTLEEAGAWVSRIDAALTLHGHDTEVGDVDACLGKLLTSSVRAFRGGDELTIGEVVARGIAAVTDPPADGGLAGPPRPHMVQRAGPAKGMRRYGLRLELVEGRLYVAIANDHDALRRIFTGTRWASGGWRDSLLNWPTARRSANKLNFLGQSSRAVLIDVATLAFEGDDARSHNQDVGGDDAGPH